MLNEKGFFQMLIFYQPRKLGLPALAAPQDLLLLKQIQKYQPPDKKSLKQQRRLIHGFHQINSMSTTGVLVGFSMAVFLLYSFSEDFFSVTPNTKISVIMLLSNLALLPFCYYIRILSIRSIRQKFQKLTGGPVD